MKVAGPEHERLPPTLPRVPADAGPTVRDATFAVLRHHGLTTLFSNPGSTEVPFLAGLPDDLEFVLALHEAAVVGLATGWALGREAPALALLHTTAGLGNAVGALATARVNRAPLVVIVGQQDRRHLALEPFLTGRLRGLAGDYPVWTGEPARPQDVPGLIARAAHEATTRRGPALVLVPMDDWLAPAADEPLRPTRRRWTSQSSIGTSTSAGPRRVAASCAARATRPGTSCGRAGSPVHTG